MYVVNKIFGYLTNPVALAAAGILLTFLVRILGCKRLGRALLSLCIVWTWLWATPFMTRKVGVPLERPWLANGRVPAIESCTNAAVIVLHGGSMGVSRELGAEMWTSADRVWTAARLWKAGKAPTVCVIGSDCEASTKGLLEDFGIPTNALVFAEAPRNTEEEVRFIAGAMKRVVGGRWSVVGNAEASDSPTTNRHPIVANRCARPRALVVTSAWHMKRTMMLYAKYAPDVEAIPVPCDFENTLRAGDCTSAPAEYLPSAEAMQANVVALHEWIGIWGYEIKWLVVGD